MKRLQKELNQYIKKMKDSDKSHLSEPILENLYSVFPFNKFEYIISHLIAKGIISLDTYLQIRTEYLRRNKYLYIFEITAPRTFGEQWAQRHLNELVPELQYPSKSLDLSYQGEYDFWYDNIKIEVKASRAVKKKSGDTLINKALEFNSKLSFDMNFQQLKPDCCDVFVWIGVWKDRIVYWVLSSLEVKNNTYYSKGQHRGNKNEGQLWIKNSNIHDFDCYKVTTNKLLETIILKANK